MSHPDDLRCWKCGTALTEVPLPFARHTECLACRAELHVCRMCRFYDVSVANACREPVADPVTEKARANFCGYFEPSGDAYRPADASVVEQARAALDALFGGGPKDK